VLHSLQSLRDANPFSSEARSPIFSKNATMPQGGTNFADFLPRRLAWGIVIVVLLAVAIFVLPNLKFGAAAKQELDLADRNTYMQMLGLTKSEIHQKWGPPSSVDPANNEIIYKMPETGTMPGSLSTSVFITFDAKDRCTRFQVRD